ncbi:hypothetical protein JOQ06_019737 [Pogonophryne albipinna]|uniref:Transposase n=1 Tax=Pogonophryne albipinna TaxID=1090488 RepID=A0AAD6FTV2_9TELE|nr:hypothetical protein JOQ06_019737 [Pogonophryne albipinna]
MSSARQKSEAQRGGRSKTSPLPDPANATRGPTLRDYLCPKRTKRVNRLYKLKSSNTGKLCLSLNELLERAATDHSGRITELEATVSRLTAQAKHVDDRCEDLEGRSRMNNIRLVGISEGLEGPRPTEFIAKLLQEILRLDEKPLLDRAHRTLRDRPREGDAPRPFVVRVHYFHIRNEILRRAGEPSPLLCQGKRISIFADYTSTVPKKRAAFGTVKRQLHSCPGSKFGLLYLAVLRITLPSGDTHRFEDPTAANEFVNTKLKKAVTPSAV